MNSVVMATYNGEKYIKEQIDSILLNIDKNDELVISDDNSKDNTINIINEYIKNYEQIRLIQHKGNIGVVKNFEKAIKEAKGDIIFLSDQDDIWVKGKIKKILSVFNNDDKVLCVKHDLKVVDSDLNEVYESYDKYRNSKKGIVNNICKNSYIGSAMAFRSKLIKAALPFPEGIPMHDQWIGILAEIYGKSVFTKDILGLYRRHDLTVTKLSHGSINSMIYNRVILIVNLLIRCKRIKSL